MMSKISFGMFTVEGPAANTLMGGVLAASCFIVGCSMPHLSDYCTANKDKLFSFFSKTKDEHLAQN